MRSIKPRDSLQGTEGFTRHISKNCACLMMKGTVFDELFRPTHVSFKKEKLSEAGIFTCNSLGFLEIFRIGNLDIILTSLNKVNFAS